MESKPQPAAGASDRGRLTVPPPILDAPVEPRIGSPHNFRTTSANTSHDGKSRANAQDLKQRVKEDMDDRVPEVTPQNLLSDFFKRVAKDTKHNSDDILDSVIEIVEEPCKGTALREAWTSYVKSGLTEKDSYKPLVSLCNEVLNTIRGLEVATKLDEVLRPEDPSHLIEFVRYDTLPLVYDWFSKPKNGRPAAPRSLTLKPDILIVMKNAIKNYTDNQAMLKRKKEGVEDRPFDPSDAPEADENGPRIRVKDVLGCIEVKRDRKFGEGLDRVLSQESGLSRVSGVASSRKRKSASSRLEVPGSQKRSKTSSGSRASSITPNAHFAQLGNYACEFLSRGPYVTHNIGIKIKNDTVQICWFDRQTTISTEEFKIVENFDLFVTSIVALSRLSLVDWGIAAELYPKNDQIEYHLQDGRTLRIDMTARPICHRVTLHGRGTMVLHGKLDDGTSKEPVVAKISHPEVRRIREQFFIDKGLQTIRKTHFPKVYHAEDIGSQTSDIRTRLNFDEGCARRRRIIVFEPLDDITSLTDFGEVTQVWMDCLSAHREMWKAGYEHGDISIYNLMYRKNAKSGADDIVGILNDWDLATSHRPEDGATARSTRGKRTGTLPFASLELVQHHDEPYVRKYRHDVESFGWCLLYICLDDSSPKNLELLRKWHIFEQSYDARAAFLKDMGDYKPREGFSVLYKFAVRFMRWLTRDVIGMSKSEDDTVNPVKPIPLKRGDARDSEVANSAHLQQRQTHQEPGNDEIWEHASGMFLMQFQYEFK